MRTSFRLIPLLAGVALAPALNAQAITAGGEIALRAGFNSNPFFSLDSPGGSGIVGGTLTGWVQRQSDVSVTRLMGIASVDQNFRYYGRPENYLGSLSHRQSFSEKLSLNGQISYQSAINPGSYFSNSASPSGGLTGGLGTPITTDLLSIGQRTRSLSGDATLQWQPTSRDSFYGGPTFNHTTYPNNGASNFDQYGMRAGYLRRLNEKLQVGIDVNAQKVNSRLYPDSTSVQGSARLVYDFSSVWEFDGSIGLINQHGTGIGTTRTVGFSAQLCGKYPRYSICVDASRQSAPSGFGGLRTDNRAHASVSYQLSSRSSVNAGAVYDISDSTGVTIIPKQKYWQLDGGYRRTLTERLAGGFSGRYQHRDFGTLPGVAGSTANGYSVTVDVSYKFGRLQ